MELPADLPAPRPPAGDGRDVLAGLQPILTVGAGAGKDLTAAFLAGAEATLVLARRHRVRYAWFQERSPSCGVHQTHSGGGLRDGPGLTTALLRLQTRATGGEITVFGVSGGPAGVPGRPLAGGEEMGGTTSSIN